MEIGCTLVSDQGKADSLVYREGVVHNCGDTLRAYESERNTSITDHVCRYLEEYVAQLMSMLILPFRP